MPSEISRSVIAVLGAMNPAIHHPSWYRRVGLMTSDAEQLALNNENLVCNRSMSQFSTTEFNISCLLERWQIDFETSDTKIPQLVACVFDEKLPQTPIEALSCSFIYHKRTMSSDVGLVLAKYFNSLPIGLNDLEGRSASFRWSSELDRTVINLQIEPSVHSSDMLFVSLSFLYGIPGIVNSPGHFDLGPILKERWPQDNTMADELTEKVLRALISSQEEHGHATSPRLG